MTNHAHILILLGRDPHLTMREVAETVGITERAVQRIVAELEDSGVLVRTREGRNNVYEVKEDQPLRHPVESHVTLAELLKLVNGPLRKRSLRR